MSERLPSGHRFYDGHNARWMWSEEAVDWAEGLVPQSVGWQDEPIDFDSVPTFAEREAGVTGGPVISLVDEPHAIALPEIYEPGYAYPVIVWFHGPGGSEEDIFTVLPEISERNYVAIALRGDRPCDNGFEWSTDTLGATALGDKVELALERLAQSLAIHPDRIYLAGVGSGGTTALELLLERPGAFAGAACLHGTFPELTQPLAHFRGLRGRRALLSTMVDSPTVPVVDLVAAGRVLYSAGMQVGTRVYQKPDAAADAKMLRDIDHWIMDSITSAVRVTTP